MLRFKNDDGSEFPEWEEKKIGELGAFIKGAALSKADISESGSPLILYGELYTTYKEVAYNIQRKTQAVVDKKYYSCVGDVIIPTSGESAEEISTATCVMVPDVILGGDLNIFRSDIVDGRIMSYILNHQAKWKIATIAQGKSIVHIQAKQLSNICVKYPLSKVEQQKIAEFLSTIDTVIKNQKETVSAWEERKKGVMQKLFSQEVRFKADDGSDFPEWEEKKLNEIAVRVTRKNKDNVTDIPLTISSADGLIDQRNFFNKVVASKDMSGYFLLKNGEFAYNKSYSKGYDFGSIKRLDLYDEGALSTLYICFTLNKNENSDFYQKYFDSLSWYPELQKICAEGARNHGLLNVPTNDFFQLKLYVPSSDKEQQKIADCLSSLDEVIEKQKATLTAWEELKKGLLQQMFV